jgi:hypothetical protein
MFKKPLREFFMRKRVLIGVAVGILVTAILVFIGVIGVSAYIGRTVSFDEDERLFNAAKSGTMTKFYANGGEYGGEYLPVEISAITLSPLSLLFSLIRRSKNAAIITTGIAIFKGARFAAVATAIAPKATCERPSPIIEYFFRTRPTPKSAAQRATSTPEITARQRNE